MNKRFFKALVLLITVLLLSSCANQKESEHIESVEQLNGKDLGCMSGSIFDQLIKEKFPDSNIIYFNSRSELLLALTTGKIEGFVSDEPVAMMMISQNDNVNYLDEAVGNVEYGICFSDESKDKLLQFNEYLLKIELNGHLKQLQDKWISVDGSNQKKEEYVLSGENGVLRCVTTPDAAPFSFMFNNEFQGFEVELLNEFCYEYGYDLEINTVAFDALLTSVAMNKYDVAFNGIYITEERAKSVNFCSPTYKADDVVMVRNNNVNENTNIIDSIKDSIYKDFIEEDRYKLLLSGAFTTLLISVLSIVFGSGYGLLMYILSRISKGFKKFADYETKVVAKLPAIVILMILFYEVFRTSSINGVTVSIIGFSFIFGNTFYNLLNTGVASVDKGQDEAAMALGYEKWLAFFHIILPQALKTILDPYIMEVIALIKNTSIVGYVSVNDITRSSDIIRGRTYDAIFPLLILAIIYYFLCSLLVWVIKVPIRAYITRKVNYND